MSFHNSRMTSLWANACLLRVGVLDVEALKNRAPRVILAALESQIGLSSRPHIVRPHYHSYLG